MTNLQSIAGSAAWVAVAAILMLVTFEPVAVETPAAEQASAEVSAPRDAAA